ncbi:MAG TPA: sigma-70 family RNA polymerase sigma factor [Candidatus Dormibacteraeota bacterium]|nr:sigma-70 family RNA polymerase sigma factor [Candidatus Dormibacteraeota bacterium]
MNTERQAWLAELYEANAGPVFKTCSGLLRNHDDAADASQEVFLRAADSLQTGTSTPAARAWLQTVARNHSLDLLRRRKVSGLALVTLGADAKSVADPATLVADRDFINGIFEKLSPRQRQALWQSAVEHRPIHEIAGQLQLSYTAAAQLIHRARRRALALAARVAIVFAILRLGRRASRISLTAAKVALVPMVAIAAISIQTSGTPATAAIAYGSAVSVLGVPLVAPAVVLLNPTSTITLALNALRQLIDQVSALKGTVPVPSPPVVLPIPSLPIPPLPIPSLP